MTKEDLNTARIPVPNLFAYGIDADCHKVDSPYSGFSYAAGIPSSYSSMTGKKVCRGDINGLGRAITQSKWFSQLGGYYTFSPEVSDYIGGYPLGAVLNYRDPETGKIRLVRSIIPDNTYNFVENPDFINDIFWSFVDNVPSASFRPRIFASFPGVVGQMRVDETVTVDYPSLFMIQTGCDSMDSTGMDSEYFMYAAVRRSNQESFYTAGLVCYLPALPSVVTPGILFRENCPFRAVTDSTFRAWNCPSPLQLYLLAGDTVKLTGNMELQGIKSEIYKYWIFPLLS